MYKLTKFDYCRLGTPQKFLNQVLVCSVDLASGPGLLLLEPLGPYVTTKKAVSFSFSAQKQSCSQRVLELPLVSNPVCDIHGQDLRAVAVSEVSWCSALELGVCFCR